MIPDPGKALTDLAGRLAAAIAPQIPAAYGAADAGLVSMLLSMLAGEAESGVERRMQDARELIELFESATHAPGDPERRQFAASAPPGLSHTQVSAWLDDGLLLLIELHGWAESADSDLNERIWDYLYRHTERYKFDM